MYGLCKARDCFFQSANPFIPLDVAEPSLAQMDQAALAVLFHTYHLILDFKIVISGKKCQDTESHHGRGERLQLDD